MTGSAFDSPDWQSHLRYKLQREALAKRRVVPARIDTYTESSGW